MSRELDVQVAEALGLEVPGLVPACRDPEIPGRWNVDTRSGQWGEMQPGYIRNCCCDLYPDGVWPDFPEDAIQYYHGHTWFCYDIVSFYSEDIAMAMTLESQMSHFILHRLALNLWQCGSAWCGNWGMHSGNECGCVWDEGEIAAEAICLAFLAARRNDGP